MKINIFKLSLIASLFAPILFYCGYNYVYNIFNKVLFEIIENEHFVISCSGETDSYQIVIFDLKNDKIKLKNNFNLIDNTKLDIKKEIRKTRCGKELSDSIQILKISNDNGIVYDKVSKLYTYIKIK